jgi:hypothetical protein
MSKEDVAAMGAKNAMLIKDAMRGSTDLVRKWGGSPVHWWGGFLSTIAGFCVADIGQEAHDVLMAVVTEAAKRTAQNTTGRRTQ